MTTEKYATISSDGLYRYDLTRRWDGGPLLEFVMLNPSTADGSVDDPTIRRCVGFAKLWGYGALIVRNLYAYRATNPAVLASVDDPIGPRNHLHLGGIPGADCTIVAWGAHPAAIGWLNGYPRDITASLYSNRERLYCLGVTANGQPRHPLYLRADATPIPWPGEAL